MKDFKSIFPIGRLAAALVFCVLLIAGVQNADAQSRRQVNLTSSAANQQALGEFEIEDEDKEEVIDDIDNDEV